MTEYVVLKQGWLRRGPDNEEVEGWYPIGSAQATSPTQAIKRVTEDTGTFLAVPERSYQPVERKQESIPRDRFTPVGESEGKKAPAKTTDD